ncbi:deoxyribose-phosphate aldolase [uncultured Selenomonas sp.]|uniref:deoxyribose-phosphate aldolase n=1 Tax=uncultured Selenomonas sp. TaxID=159275 RepID=UPI0028E44873|nr:deoxyribose-phosphate aldolase [uncultured Selenomonas sp.]
MKLSRYIDSSPLNPSMTSEEVRAAIEEAVRLECRSVCVQPSDIPLAVRLCRNTDTHVCTVLDFPHGKSPAAVKEIEARYYMEYGAEELDMVMNYGLARSGHWEEVEEEIRAVVNAAHARNVIVKVIFEASQLTAEEIARATEVSIAAGADFVKTATGFFGTGATEEQLQIMLDTAQGRCKVKASGGIRDYATAKAFLEMGVERLGIGSSSVPKILAEEANS